MNFKIFAVVAAAGVGLSCATCQAVQVYSFADVVGANIQFNGTSSSFQFNANGSGNQWDITGESGQPSGSVLGLIGSFTGGPWTYGAISMSDGGLVQSATVNLPTATLSINDGAGYFATAVVTWGMVSTFESIGGLNASLSVNLSDLGYTGTNPDLAAFFQNPSGALDVSFNFNPSGTLTALSSGSGPYTSSYSGSLTALAPVPEPAPVLIIGLGFAVFGWKILRKKAGPATR